MDELSRESYISSWMCSINLLEHKLNQPRAAVVRTGIRSAVGDYRGHRAFPRRHEGMGTFSKGAILRMVTVGTGDLSGPCILLVSFQYLTFQHRLQKNESLVHLGELKGTV